MDPITAIGAASSVIGIAAFAIELCEVIHEFSSQVHGAREGLLAVSSSIESTADSLRLIHQYLDMEAENLASDTSTRLFSNDALIFVKNNADRCLLVFWRIEAVMLNKADGASEEQLRRRLDEFNAGTGTGPGGTDKAAIEVSLVPASLPLLKRLRWPFVTARLAEYRSQLQFHQQCLSLIIMTVFIGEVRSKPSLENKDINAIAKAAVDINKASREIKNIVKTVASIRDMLQEGDIDLRVLFPPREPGPPPYYRKGTAAVHGATTSDLRQQPASNLADGANAGPTSYSQSTEPSTEIRREPGVGTSSSGLPRDSSRESFSLSQTSGRLPAASNILQLKPQTNLEPGQPTFATDENSSEFRDPPKKQQQQLPTIAPLLRPAAADASGKSQVQKAKNPLGGDYEGTTDASPGASVQNIEPPTAADPEEEHNRQDEQDVAESETNENGDDDDITSREWAEETEATSALELGCRKYQNGPVSRYMIKQHGGFFALDTARLRGLRRMMEAFRWWWWPSQEAMERTLASATEEQLNTLGSLLQPHCDDDGEILSRSLLRVKEVGRRSRRAERSGDFPGDGDNGTALLVLVETLPKEKFASIRERDAKISVGNASQQGAWVQDLSTTSDHIHSLIFLLTTHHVWMIQPQESDAATGARNPDWTRCLVSRGKMSEEEIIRLRGPVGETGAQEERQPNQTPGLTPNQQSQVDRLNEQLQAEAADTEFAYSLEKVDIVRTGKQRGILRTFQKRNARAAAEASSILVFFTRAPRDGVDLDKLYRTEQRRRKAKLHRAGGSVDRLSQMWEGAASRPGRVYVDNDRESEKKRGFEEPGSPGELDVDVAGETKGDDSFRSGPAYTRMSTQDLELETLRVLSIDFEMDKDDPDHVIIKRPIDEDEQERLLAHTRAIREARLASADAGPSIQVEDADELLSTSSKAAPQKTPVTEPETQPKRPSSILDSTIVRRLPQSSMPGTSGLQIIPKPAPAGDAHNESQSGGAGLGKEGEWTNPDGVDQSDDDWGGDDNDDDDDLVERLLARWTPAGVEEWHGSHDGGDETLRPTSGGHTSTA
ncbi:hypothetical protein MAPG_04494 [Magnaporthiopsis poae ATCC 64411]|uniref:Fungal N-terminal domain-containing protein n=1 Tax=Magnaporthiopsis poae (strain ATCC 64411 / 73-15) TaxID=644358 RepID=A0A0C4DWW0_MAGP6|nr:hypothetical protein MAPG_04494 [Magnaporthiopsis poae ATCC 64411]